MSTFSCTVLTQKPDTSVIVVLWLSMPIIRERGVHSIEVGPDTLCTVDYKVDGDELDVAAVAKAMEQIPCVFEVLVQAQESTPPTEDPDKAESDRDDFYGMGEEARTPRELLCDEIFQEREYQDLTWGGEAHDDAHEPNDWMNIIDNLQLENRAEFGTPPEMIECYASFQTYTPASLYKYREGMVKIAATAVAAIESFDRKRVWIETQTPAGWRTCDHDMSGAPDEWEHPKGRVTHTGVGYMAYDAKGMRIALTPFREFMLACVAVEAL